MLAYLSCEYDSLPVVGPPVAGDARRGLMAQSHGTIPRASAQPQRTRCETPGVVSPLCTSEAGCGLSANSSPATISARGLESKQGQRVDTLCPCLCHWYG